MSKESKPIVISIRQPFQPALLDCQGKPSCGKWVDHVFTKCMKRDVKAEIWDHIYTCKKCGAGRVWGNSSDELIGKPDSKDN